MKKIILLLAVFWAMCGLTGCGDYALAGDCKCVVKLADVPKELKMLNENVYEQLYVSFYLENIYTEEDMSIELTAEDDFQMELNLKPGTYTVKYCSAGPYYLLPIEVEPKQESVQITKDDVANIEISITNTDEVVNWIWNTNAGREVLEADAFSHMVQFEGQMIDVKQIANYVEFNNVEQVKPYEKQTFYGTKGVSITVLNEGATLADWQDCKLMEVSFGQNNIIWGQGASVGMDVTEAVHAENGLYGMPSKMSGTVLVGTGYDRTSVSWIDEKSGDKLTLEMTSSGSYICSITYAFEAFE